MKAIILAAGRGSRMGILTDEKPKCLLEVYAKPLIEHQITALKQAGIEEIGIVTGYKSELLKKYGTCQFYNPRWFETNMVYSLLCAKAWLDTDDCIVSYADIFYKNQIVVDLINCADSLAIAYDPNWLQLWIQRFDDPLIDAETFRVDQDGYLLEIGQKPKIIEEIQGQYMGLLKLKKGFFKEQSKLLSLLNIDRVDVTSMLQSFINKNILVKTIPNNNSWGEYDNESDLKVFL